MWRLGGLSSRGQTKPLRRKWILSVWKRFLPLLRTAQARRYRYHRRPGATRWMGSAMTQYRSGRTSPVQPAIRSANIVPVEHRVPLAERILANGHRSGILWLTGLSGAGKSTLAMELERHLFDAGYQVTVLDGDNIRHGLSADLGFSPEDRAENIRRVGEAALICAQAGMLVVTAFISPCRADRDRARRIGGDLFHEIYVQASLEVCESRDPKGLYAKARRGEIPEFTGISAPYQPPLAPEMVVNTGAWGLEQSLARLLEYVHGNFALSGGR
ncbi:MAG: adenylyl-sulfate kinase [Rhodospirillales bacterium]|nr:adenylyl-sulfate kinase [Rhodospirillales bacterium]